MGGKPGKEGRGPDAPFVFNVKWIWTEMSCAIFEDALQGRESEFLVLIFHEL
jgi:hypothetical protein